MGRLIKNHWARLIILSAAAYQVAAAIEGFFWPKVFWDFLTRNLDGAVEPVPVLQTLNLLFGLFGFAALTAVLLYQGTNAALYYIIGIIVYFWAYSEGEVVCEKPWTLPKRQRVMIKV